MIGILLAVMLSATTPQGWELALAGPIEPMDPLRVAGLRTFGIGEAFVHVADTQDLAWYSFALDNQGPDFRWPARWRIGLVSSSGAIAWALEQAAITPEGRRVGIGGTFPVAGPADAFARKRFRGGSVRTVIFAAFPRGTDPSPAGVRLGRPGEQTGAAPPDPGAR